MNAIKGTLKFIALCVYAGLVISIVVAFWPLAVVIFLMLCNWAWQECADMERWERGDEP